MRCFKRDLHVIMPMAGEGSRFANKGYTIPKPLITLDGVPLFHRAISSICGIDSIIKYSFIVRKEHIEKYKIDTIITELYPNAKIFSVDKTTRGSVETCRVAQSNINKDDGILILDCDLEFISIEFIKNINNILSKQIEEINGGLLASFDSNNNRFSYAETDSNNIVIRTAEKNVISNHALCGAYFFSKADSFLESSKYLLSQSNENIKEYYVSLLYNILIKKGEIVKLIKLDAFHSYGTPEELENSPKNTTLTP